MILGFIGCVLLGFGAGLFLSRIKNRWCPECGATTLTLEQRRRQQLAAKLSVRP